MSITSPETCRPRSHAAKAGRAETLHGSWEDRSACFNRPSEWWDDEATLALQEKARKQCLGCPVFELCLSAAMATEPREHRSGMKAGLTETDRSWLQRYSNRYGEYDAEEARLLALEAHVSSRPVTDIAEREGAGGVTLKLAARLLPKEVTPRIDRIRSYRRQGLSWGEIDLEMGFGKRSTMQYVQKWREAAVKRGEVIPRELRAVLKPFTDEQVLRIRERAASGASDTVQARELGVSRSAIADTVWGRTYREVGGPIRSKAAA